MDQRTIGAGIEGAREVKAISDQPSAISLKRSEPKRKAESRKQIASRCAGFTLIELLTVIAIIGILAALTVGGAYYARTKAKISRAQAEIAAIETALESYKNDNGIYPVTPPNRAPGASTNSWYLYIALAGTPKKYFTFKPNQLSITGTPPNTITNIIDPFGNLYSYYCTLPLEPDQTNRVSFDLWSYGPDGRDDTDDDITNWRR